MAGGRGVLKAPTANLHTLLHLCFVSKKELGNVIETFTFLHIFFFFVLLCQKLTPFNFYTKYTAT